MALALAGGDALPERTGPPVEELAVERTVLEPNRIELSLRNAGPDPVEISQAFVNDAFVDFQADATRESAGWKPRRSRWHTPGRTVSRTSSRW